MSEPLRKATAPRVVPVGRRRGVSPRRAAGAASALELAEQVVDVLRAHVHRGQREVQIQDSIERVLSAAGLYVEREFRLSAEDRPDFFIGNRVVVEVKMRAGGSEVLWQLARYASHDRVQAIVVASPRFSTLAGIPAEIHRTPVRVVGLPGPGLRL